MCIYRIIGEIFRILVEEKLHYRVEKVSQDEEQHDRQINFTDCHHNKDGQ